MRGLQQTVAKRSYWLAGAAGFEPLHLTRTRQESPPMRRDSNLCISEFEFTETLNPGAGLELAHPGHFVCDQVDRVIRLQRAEKLEQGADDGRGPGLLSAEDDTAAPRGIRQTRGKRYRASHG